MSTMSTMSTMTAVKSEYPKIETLYNRDPANMRHVVMGELRMPEFELIDRWHVTEKIHGTNIRVIYQDGLVRFGGKTDEAQMPLYLLDALRPLFPLERFTEIWPTDTGEQVAEDEQMQGPYAQMEQPYVVLYGEGYGAKIEKGGSYRADQSFRIFDVAVRGEDHKGPRWWWLEWDDVVDVAGNFGVATVPVLNPAATTAEAIALVRQDSVVARLEGQVAVAHEGVVARTVPQLYTRRGDRLMWKLKVRDLPDSAGNGS